MITKIKIHNFQCHKDLDLDLGRSTVLQGNSNCGKTAVLRALYWVLFNEAPHDFVSYWAQKKLKKGFTFKNDEYTSVLVHVDGHSIERKRSNEFNGYIVDGKIYEALRTDVPEEVTKIFNLSDASIQRQMDAPFLLSSTPGEASQYLSNLAGLGCVDDILTLAKRKVAETSTSVDEVNGEVESLNKEIATYSWVGDAEKLLEQATATEPIIADLQRKISALSQSIESYKAIKDYPEIPEWLTTGDRSEQIQRSAAKVEALKSYVAACSVLNRVCPALDGVDGLEIPKPPKHTEKELSTLIRSIREYRGTTANVADLTDALAKISKLKEPKPCKWENVITAFSDSISSYEDYSQEAETLTAALAGIEKLKQPKPCKWTDKDKTALVRSVREYHSVVNTIMDSTDGLDEAYASIEGVACPVCGRPLTKDTCLL